MSLCHVFLRGLGGKCIGMAVCHWGRVRMRVQMQCGCVCTQRLILANLPQPSIAPRLVFSFRRVGVYRWTSRRHWHRWTWFCRICDQKPSSNRADFIGMTTIQHKIA